MVLAWVLPFTMSHPVRVRGLKQTFLEENLAQVGMSHPVRVRGLKLVTAICIVLLVFGRTPCGCVD